MEANLMLGHPADARDYGIASDILKSLEIEKVCLMTNNPDKVNQLTELGIDVAERMELIVGVGNNNVEYLTTKVEKMGHQINEDHLNMG
jgi:3,4-dihydroxy 2-butanone 4-phosphate synthase/GTP cyclohydrolase II